MGLIVFKKILSESEYGEPINFYIGNATSAPTTSGYAGDYYYDEEQIANKSSLTSLESLNASVGDRFQAFTTGGDKLGFCLMYKGTIRYVNYDRFCWMLYNEEIGCYAMTYTRKTNDAEDSVLRTYIIMNGEYNANDFTTLLKNAESKWKLKGDLYKKGLDNNRYALLQIISEKVSSNITRYYTSIAGGADEINCYGRMRYFSSWYMLISGNFYQKSTLKSFPIADGKNTEFYLGKVVSYSEKKPYYNPDNFTLYETYDPSYVFTDVIFGTDPCKYIKKFKEYGGSSILFANGVSLNLTHNGSNGIATLSAPWGDTSSLGTVYISQEFSGLNKLITNDRYNISALQKLLNGANDLYGDYSNEGVQFGPMLFISPEYNNWSVSEFKTKLLEKGKTVSEDGWIRLLNRVLFFAQTAESPSSTTEFKEAYDVDVNQTQYTYSGRFNIVSSSNSATRLCTTKPSITSDNTINIDSAEKWVKFIDFYVELKDPETGGTGGSFGGTGGGTGLGDDGGDDIETNTVSGHASNAAFAAWYLGTNFKKRSEEISAWIRDTALITEYSTQTKMQTILGIKQIYFPESPITDHTGDGRLAGINGEIVCTGSLPITTQFSTITVGQFSLQRYFDNFLDFAPYTKITLYLPYASSIDLDPSDIVGNTCTLKASVDWYSGNIVYQLYVNNGIVDSVMYTATGNCAVDLPLTAEDYSGKISSMINTTLGAAATVAGVALAPITGGSSLVANIGAIGAGVAATGAMASAAITMGNSKIGNLIKGTNFSMNGLMMAKVPYLSITRPKMQLPQNFGSQYGWKTSVSGSLGSFNGMTVVKDIHLEGFGTATSEEIDKIESLLKQGVIL